MENHGGNVLEVAGRLGVDPREILDFSSNLNPLGPPPGVWEILEVLASKKESWIIHPPLFPHALREALARHLDVEPDRVLPVPGSAWAIYEVVKVFRPREVAFPLPTFGDYARAARSVGARVVEHRLSPRRAFRLCLGEMAWKVEDGTDLVFICNPNNPTGYYMPEDELEALVRWCRDKDCLVVVDEAFLPFLGRRGMVPVVREYPNLVVLGSFTKIYRLPGIRLGYVVAPPSVVERLLAGMPPWAFGPLAQEVGLACLREEGFVEESRAYCRREMAFLFEGLRDLGFRVYPSSVHYFLFQASVELGEELLGKGILVRDCSSMPGLGPGFYRIAPRKREGNLKLLKVLEGLGNSGPGGSMD